VSLVGRVLALASLRIDLKRLARLFLPGPRAEDSTDLAYTLEDTRSRAFKIEYRVRLRQAFEAAAEGSVQDVL
jgi:hypothetical protein